MDWCLVSAVTDEALVKSCLLRSPDVLSANKVICQRGFPNAGIAFNVAIEKVDSEYMIFSHQDVYLPPGWMTSLERAIVWLESHDPNWGVLGLVGVAQFGERLGYVYSTGLMRFVGWPMAQAMSVRVLDEIVLVLKRGSGIKFDKYLPGFHLYGTDICLEAEARGMRNYVLPCFALHNSRGIKWFPLSFWKAYMYLRRKWRHLLPITTPCTTITVGCMPIFTNVIRTGFSSIRGMNIPGCRVVDPERFYLEHLGSTIEMKS